MAPCGCYCDCSLCGHLILSDGSPVEEVGHRGLTSIKAYALFDRCQWEVGSSADAVPSHRRGKLCSVR